MLKDVRVTWFYGGRERFPEKARQLVCCEGSGFQFVHVLNQQAPVLICAECGATYGVPRDVPFCLESLTPNAVPYMIL